MADQVVFQKYWDGDPAPIWVALGEFGRRPPIDGMDLIDMLLSSNKRDYAFRSVSIDRLPYILRSGIDIEPTSGRIWVADFDKAWEYGDLPKVVMALDQDYLQPSFTSRSRGSSTEEVLELRSVYPFHRNVGDDEVWYSKTADPHPGYEIPYGRYIAGDAVTALAGVIIFGSSSQISKSMEAFRHDIGRA